MNVHEHLEFRLLKYVIAVAETGTFTGAAARLHVSQSAVSTQIAELEEILGFLIFDRDRKNALTIEGKILVRYGQESLQTREHIVQTLRAIHAGALLPLRIGFTPFVQRSLLRSVAGLYREVLLDCEIIPETGDTDEIVARVKQSELHAGLVTLPISQDGLEVTLLDRERLVVLMRSDDPLAKQDAIAPSALDQKLCIFTYQRNHPAAYNHLVAMLSELKIKPLPYAPTLNMDHVQWMVHEGVCISLVPASQPLDDGLVTRPIAGVDWTIDCAFIARSGTHHPALSLFTLELRKFFRVRSQTSEKASIKVLETRERPRVGRTHLDPRQSSFF